MKINCVRDELLAAFQTAATVAPQRSPKPILQNLKLDVQKDHATLLATNMDVGIRVAVPGVTVDSPGLAVVPVGRFGAILRESSDESLLIEAGSQGIEVRGERSQFKLPGENPEDFPAVADFKEEAYYEIPARLLKEMIRRTLFATDTESSRFALGGVLVEIEGEKMVFVGTDGRRLAKMEGPVQAVGGATPGEGMTIVPTHSLQLIERALSDGDAEVRIAIRSNDILVKSPRATISSKLVEGRFPKWRDVLPDRSAGMQVELSAGVVFSAVRQAAIVASEESRGIDFSFGKGVLVLSGQTAELGESRVEVPIAYEGEEVTVTLDHRFVADFLKVLDPEKTITATIRDAENAALFSTDDGYDYVVMPLARDH